MAASIGPATWAATTSGPDPGAVATTATVGISSDGMSSCRRDVSETTPNTATIPVTSATTARLAKLNRVSLDTVPPLERAPGANC